MALVLPHPPGDRKRVKVYELRNNDWFDRGTGFCVGQIVDVSQRADAMRIAPVGLGFWLTNGIEQDEPRIYVESEDQPERTLLETKINKDDAFQKQQGGHNIYSSVIAATDTIKNRDAHRVDRATSRHRHGPQLPGGRGVRGDLVSERIAPCSTFSSSCCLRT